MIRDRIVKLIKRIKDNAYSPRIFREEVIPIYNESLEMVVGKNTDYGDSFSRIFEKYGLLSSCIRLEDKINRLSILILDDPKVKNESMEDTLFDLIGYSVLTIRELRKRKK